MRTGITDRCKTSRTCGRDDLKNNPRAKIPLQVLSKDGLLCLRTRTRTRTKSLLKMLIVRGARLIFLQALEVVEDDDARLDSRNFLWKGGNLSFCYCGSGLAHAVPSSGLDPPDLLLCSRTTSQAGGPTKRSMMSTPTHRARKKKKTEAPPQRTATAQDVIAPGEQGRAGPEFPLDAFLWSARGSTSQWITLPLILIFTGLFKWAVSLWGYSGFQKPPMHGDFEAQRHWMELTTHLPMSMWYYYDLPYWGLDYPPLTAYHSWLLGKM